MDTNAELTEAKVESLITAAQQVLSDIDDDSVAERNNIGVLAPHCGYQCSQILRK